MKIYKTKELYFVVYPRDLYSICIQISRDLSDKLSWKLYGRLISHEINLSKFEGGNWIK